MSSPDLINWAEYPQCHQYFDADNHIMVKEDVYVCSCDCAYEWVDENECPDTQEHLTTGFIHE